MTVQTADSSKVWSCSPTVHRWPRCRACSRRAASRCRWPRSYPDSRSRSRVVQSAKPTGSQVGQIQRERLAGCANHSGRTPAGEGTDPAEPAGTGAAEGSAGAATAGHAAATTTNGGGAGQIDATKPRSKPPTSASARLDDYNILDEVTVYFANGKVTVDPKYKPQLLHWLRRPRPSTATYPGEGLCFVGGKSCAQPETERRPRQQRDPILAAAGTHSVDQNARPGRDG